MIIANRQFYGWKKAFDHGDFTLMAEHYKENNPDQKPIHWMTFHRAFKKREASQKTINAIEAYFEDKKNKTKGFKAKKSTVNPEFD
jgi:hypothetical protein